ncbi:MAG: hypothetical protein U0871_16535 [Gemmataceae bacterium]
MRRGWAVCLLMVAGLAPVTAQQPTGGAVPAGFRCYIVTDDRFDKRPAADGKGADPDPRDRTNRMHDPVVELGLNPVVMILTRSAPAGDAPVARLIKKVGDLPAEQRKLLGRGRPISVVNPVAVFLTLDKDYPEDEQRDVKAAAVRDLATALKVRPVLYGLAAGKSPQTEAWGVAEGTETVVVAYNRMMVVKRWEFPAGTPPTDAQIQEIVDVADRMAGVKK